MAAVALMLSEEELEARIRAVVEPLRAEIQRLRASADGMITQDEAASRLNVSRRAVQQFLKDGRLEVVPVAGVRMVRWPPRVLPR